MTKAVLCGLLLLMLPRAGNSAGNGSPTGDDLYGTWRLVSYKRTLLATGETEDQLGKSPHGFINYGRDGRVIVIIAAEHRPKPQDLAKTTDRERAELFNSLTAYAGTYSFDGKTITHHVDISWNEIWTGTDQVRDVMLEGNKLTLTTPPAPNGHDGKMSVSILTWEKME
jgi:Lipocalin-like domain